MLEPDAVRAGLAQPAAVALLRLCGGSHRDGLLDTVLPSLEPALRPELERGLRKPFAEQVRGGVRVRVRW